MHNSNTTLAKPPLIIAHRGASAVAPENTLAAFARAIDLGADGIELDVRLSRDGVPVAIHDETLTRTGLREEAVGHMTAAQLGRVDVGSWFNRAHLPLARAEYSPQFIPPLDEVLNRLAKPEIMVYVEMKTDRGEDAYRDLAQSVARLISDDGLCNQVVVISFNLKAIAEIKQLDSAIRTGALFEPKRNPKAAIRKRQIIQAAVDCGADEILWHRLIVNSRAVRLATERNLRSIVWTVDDPKWLERGADLGIHALITNDPGRMIAKMEGFA